MIDMEHILWKTNKNLVWHGLMDPYQDYAKYTSRFVTEFGFESAASHRTLNKGITELSERHWVCQIHFSPHYEETNT